MRWRRRIAINAGATIPNQFTVFNVDQAANAIVNANQTLVQQAIAQGYITAEHKQPGDRAGADPVSGWCKSDLATEPDWGLWRGAAEDRDLGIDGGYAEPGAELERHAGAG